MRKPMTALAAVFVFTACDGDPFSPPPTTTGATGGSSVISLPGTTNPAAGVSIFRYEALDAATGSGYAESISYDAASDRFFVDNLAFDGDNFYERDDVQASLGPFQVYESDSTLNDASTGTPVNQFQHKAIRGISTSGNTEFAIVRTGQYVGYGFGGFLYQRHNSVNLPNAGQATYTGEYAGVRDFLARGGLEYVTGDTSISIDFADFNDGAGVSGRITNRQIFSIDRDPATGVETGTTNITSTVAGALVAGSTTLPVLLFTVGPGAADANGEITNGLQSSFVGASGALEAYEEGTYYAMVAGDNAEEIVGIVVVTSQDPRFAGVTARETGGFIVYR